MIHRERLSLSDSLVRSHGQVTRPGCFLAASSRASFLRPHIATRLPAARNFSANPSPMPVAPPVMRTSFPEKSTPVLSFAELKIACRPSRGKGVDQDGMRQRAY